MKTILLILAIGCSISTFAQKKLRAQVAKGYNEAGNAGPIDSTAYTYQDWRGSVTTNQAEFNLNRTFWNTPYVPTWNFVDLDVDFTTLERWDGSYYPLNNYSTEVKTYNSNFECTSKVISPNNYHYSYEYTATGKISIYKGWEDNSGTISDSFSIISTYDNLDRLIAEKSNYTDVDIFYIDSFEYNNTSINVSRFSRYSSDDDITYHLVLESIMTYTGNEVTTGDVYQDTDDDPLTPLDFVSHVEYDWQGSLLSSIDFHSVNTGVIDPFPTNTTAYTYNSSDQLLSILNEGETQNLQNLTYDSDGFLVKWDLSILNGASEYYIKTSTEWLFDATNSINQLDDISISIYPNPVSEELYLDSKNVESLKVYSLSGQLIKESMQENSISVAELESGMYYLEATIGNERITKNFIKQ